MEGHAPGAKKGSGGGSLPLIARGCGDLTHEYIVRRTAVMIGKLRESFLASVFRGLGSSRTGAGVDTRVRRARARRQIDALSLQDSVTFVMTHSPR